MSGIEVNGPSVGRSEEVLVAEALASVAGPAAAGRA